jgi:hypothetical protein
MSVQFILFPPWVAGVDLLPFILLSSISQAAVEGITWNFSDATEDDSETIPSRWLREVIQYNEVGRATITVIGALCCVVIYPSTMSS